MKKKSNKRFIYKKIKLFYGISTNSIYEKPKKLIFYQAEL